MPSAVIMQDRLHTSYPTKPPSHKEKLRDLVATLKLLYLRLFHSRFKISRFLCL